LNKNLYADNEAVANEVANLMKAVSFLSMNMSPAAGDKCSDNPTRTPTGPGWLRRRAGEWVVIVAPKRR